MGNLVISLDHETYHTNSGGLCEISLACCGCQKFSSALLAPLWVRAPSCHAFLHLDTLTCTFCLAPSPWNTCSSIELNSPLCQSRDNILVAADANRTKFAQRIGPVTWKIFGACLLSVDVPMITNWDHVWAL